MESLWADGDDDLVDGGAGEEWGGPGRDRARDREHAGVRGGRGAGVGAGGSSRGVGDRGSWAGAWVCEAWGADRGAVCAGRVEWGEWGQVVPDGRPGAVPGRWRVGGAGAAR